MTHPPHKIPVGSGNTAFALGQDAHIAAQAGAAGGGGDHRACIDKGGGVPPDDALPVDGHGGRNDNAAHPLGNLLAIQNAVSRLHILHASVGAGADDHLVDLNVLQLPGRVGILRQMGAGHRGLNGRQVNFDGFFIGSIFVGGINHRLPLRSALQIFQCPVVHRENAVFRTGLNGHIADAQPVIHGQRSHAGARKLHALVQRAVHADPANDGEDHVLPADVGLQCPRQVEANGRGDLKPCLARGHTCGHIRAANTGGEGAQGTIGAGVAVCADDAVSGGDDALLRKQSMLDAHLAHVIEMADAVLAGELPAGFGLLGSLDILVGHKMVQDDDHLVLVIDPVKACFFELIHRHRGSDIIAQNNVQLGLDQLSGAHLRQTCMGRQNLLGHCHCHGSFLLIP